MKYLSAFVLAVVTGGAVDYLPGAHRPWIVDFRSPRRYAGRGRTLYEAARQHFQGGKS